MPGLIGLLAREPDADLGSTFARLEAPLNRGGRIRRERLLSPDGRWGLARFHLGVLHPEGQLRPGSRVQVLFHGDLDNADELRRELGPALPEDGRAPGVRSDVVGLLEALYRRFGRDFASRLRGAFVVAVVDDEAEQLVLSSDVAGSYPVYWLWTPRHFAFAPEVKALLRDPTYKPTLNRRAVADLLECGFVLGDRTLADGVKLLPPASTLTYRWRENTATIASHGRIDHAVESWQGDHAAYLERVIHSFSAAVGRALAGPHRFGLSLSGGLDSRMILSAIDTGRTPVSTYTLGVKGCADDVIARRLSRLVGSRHRFFELDAAYLTEFLGNLRRMVTLTDGMYVTQGLTELLALEGLQQADFSVLLRGHGGELAKTSLAWPFHTDERIRAMRTRDELVPYLVARMSRLSGGTALRDVLTDGWYEAVRHGARQSLEESLASVERSPANLASHLYLWEYHRRSAIASLEVFRTVVEVRLPFMDEEFLRVCLGGRSEWREGTEIHRAAIGRLKPALLRVRNSNTGAPAGAGPKLEAVLDKVNSVLRRLDVYGYRHYHNFGTWMSQQLVTAVEGVLLSGDSLARGLYRESGLRRVIEASRRGAKEHSYLLQALLVLELWQQESL